MEKTQVAKAIEQARKESPKREFKQSFDLVINFLDLDIKKPENQVDIFVPITGTKNKICALVAPELMAQAKANCDKVIPLEEFDKYTNKKDIKKLAVEFDYFMAQSTIMPQIAKVFGRYLGPRGKMPNPKAGAVVAPNMNIKANVDRLKMAVRVSAKIQTSAKCKVGTEDMKDEEVQENILAVYNAVKAVLPGEDKNIKNMIVKLTMGPPVKIIIK